MTAMRFVRELPRSPPRKESLEAPFICKSKYRLPIAAAVMRSSRYACCARCAQDAHVPEYRVIDIAVIGARQVGPWEMLCPRILVPMM